MFEKRSKELGTYMLLGIKKKEIAHLVVIENILLGILAIVLALSLIHIFMWIIAGRGCRGTGWTALENRYSTGFTALPTLSGR